MFAVAPILMFDRRDHPPPCDAGDRRALGRASASLDPYRLPEAELGSPSKSETKTPSITAILLS
jgi:hypothetical protein